MRKILAIVLMAALMCVGGSTVYAKEAYVANAEADVFARYSRDMVDKDCYRIEISKKTVHQKLPNGMTVQMKRASSADSGITVVISMVSEKEPLNWVTNQVTNYGEVVSAMYVAFYKDGLKVQPKGNMSITLKLPKKYSANAAYYLSSAGKSEKIQGNYKKRSIELDEKEGYVVLMKEKTSGAKCYIEKQRQTYVGQICYSNK